MDSVSVIIPMFNSQDTIIDALESVKKQTALNRIIQILVIDDGSSDNSSEVVKEYQKENNSLPIELFEQCNQGVAVSRNVGLEHAKGEWVAFLDSDDEWNENKIARQLEIVESHPEIDFLGAGYDNTPLIILGRKIDSLYKANVKDLALKYFPCTPSILMRTSIYHEIGGFNEKWRYAEDGEYYTRICMKYNYYYLPESLVSIGHGKRTFGEKGLSGNLKAMYKGNVNIIKRLKSENAISGSFFMFLRVFYFLKYCRRIMITKLAARRS